MVIQSALWILMACGFSTRASAATVLIMDFQLFMVWKNPTNMWYCTHYSHNEHDGISNHQPHDCLLNRLFRRKSKKTSKLCVITLCAENSLVTGEFPPKWPVTQKMFHLMMSSRSRCFWQKFCSLTSKLSSEFQVVKSNKHGTDFSISPYQEPTSHIEAETRWPPLCRRHFLMHYLEWKCLNFNWNFTEVCY